MNTHSTRVRAYASGTSLRTRFLRPALAALLLVAALCAPGLALASVAPSMSVQVQQTSIVDNDNSGTLTPGDQINFNVVATDDGTTNLTNVQVTDSIDSSPSNCNLSPNQTCVLSASYVVQSADATAGSVTLTGSATSNEIPSPVTGDLQLTVFSSGSGAHLTGTMMLSGNDDPDHSGTVTAGDTLTYSVAFTNDGSVTVTNLQFSLSADSAQLNFTPPSCASVAVGASCSFTGTHTVTSADAQGGQLKFGVHARVDQTTDSDFSANTITPVDTAGGAAMSLVINLNNYVDVDHSGTQTAGDQFNVIATATNFGKVALTNVQVGVPQASPASTSCPSLAVGATCVLTSTYTITATDIANSATQDLGIAATATSDQVPGPVDFTFFANLSSGSIGSAALQIVGGNGQTGTPGTTLPTPLTVRLLDANNAPLAGKSIQYIVVDGNGTSHASPISAITDSNGQASTQLVLGTAPGPVSVYAGGDDKAPSVLFTEIIAAPAIPPALTLVSGNNQVLPVNTVSQPLVVQLMNNGSPVANATIHWSGSNVQLTSATSLTDANGRASNTAKVVQAGAASVSASSTSPAAGPVSFTLNGDLTSIPGLTPQETALAGALNSACPALSAQETLTPAQQDLLAQCQALASNAGTNPAQAANALNQMLPHDALIQSNASVLVSTAQFDNIKARMAALRSGAHGGSFGGLAFVSPDGALQFGRYGDSALGLAGAAKTDDAGSAFDRWGFFLSGSFGWGSADPRTATPGYGFHSNGLTAGVDYRINDGWVAGVSAGFARYSSSVDNVGGGLDTHGWSLSGYTTLYRKNDWYVDGVFTWGNNTYDINRRIVYALGASSVNQTAHSSSGGDTLAGALTVGRDFNRGAWLFGPYFRGTWSHTKFDGYQESLVGGAGSGLGLAVQGRSLNSTATVLGAKLNYSSSQSWGIMSPHAEVEWEHEYQDNPDTLNASFLADPTASVFQLKGDPVDTNFFRLGLGVSFTWPHGKSGFVYYEKTLGLTGLTQDNLTLGFRMEF